MKIGLSTKITIFFVLQTLISGLLLGYFLINLQKSTLLEQFDERANLLLDSMAVSSEFPLLMADKTALSKIGNYSLRRRDVVFCQISDSSRKTMFKEGTTFEKIGLKKYTKTVVTKKMLDNDAEDMILGVGTLIKEEIGTISLYFSLQNLVNEQKKVKKTIFAIVSCSILISFCLIFVLARHFVTHPLRELIMGTNKISQGNLDYKVPVKSSDEIATLAKSFNKMSEELKKAEAQNKTLMKDIESYNEKLEKSNKDLQNFVYIASHDLREPIRKISAFGDLLSSSVQDQLDEDQRENLDFMIDGSERMQTMIEDLLTYSRVTTNAKPLQEINIHEIVDDLIKLELAYPIEESKGTVKILGNLPLVKADPSQAHQLLQNLISNGLKYQSSEKKPEIIISGEDMKNGMIKIFIKDNGIGIPQRFTKEIFAMFKRLQNKNRFKGTGIGLAVCERIVSRHGGEIGVESTEGNGSTFWFTLQGTI